MMPQKRTTVAAGLLAAVPLGLLLLAAGCSKTPDAAEPPPPPGAQMPGGGPGGGGRGALVSATASGAELYQLKCQGCHGSQGQGARGPSLGKAAGRPAAQIAQVILEGRGRMPAFANQLTPAQIISVAAYVKQFPAGGR